MQFLRIYIDASTLSSMLVVIFLIFLRHICPCHLWDICSYALSLVFLFCGSSLFYSFDSFSHQRLPSDRWVKLNESEKSDIYLDLAGELNNLRSMKVAVITIVIGALVTIPKGFIKGLENWEIKQGETIQTTALWRSARILRRVLQTWGDLQSLKIQWRTIS